MSNKQIEEMANDIAKICPDLVENCCGQINCVTHLTLSLSKIGYRKATDVAEEISRDIIEPVWEAYKNSASAETVLLVALICESINAQLKKKYTEGEQ